MAIKETYYCDNCEQETHTLYSVAVGIAPQWSKVRLNIHLERRDPNWEYRFVYQHELCDDCIGDQLCNVAGVHSNLKDRGLAFLRRWGIIKTPQIKLAEGEDE